MKLTWFKCDQCEKPNPPPVFQKGGKCDICGKFGLGMEYAIEAESMQDLFNKIIDGAKITLPTPGVESKIKEKV